MTNWYPDPNALRGRIAVVAGATREAGATVICTGRSSRVRSLQSDYVRPETIEETAELVTSLGGQGIPFVVDHLGRAAPRDSSGDHTRVASLGDDAGELQSY